MFQEFYAKSDLLVWPLIGLLIFVVVFVGVLAYVFLGLRDKKRVDENRSAAVRTRTRSRRPGRREGPIR